MDFPQECTMDKWHLQCSRARLQAAQPWTQPWLVVPFPSVSGLYLLFGTWWCSERRWIMFIFMQTRNIGYFRAFQSICSKSKQAMPFAIAQCDTVALPVINRWSLFPARQGCGTKTGHGMKWLFQCLHSIFTAWISQWTDRQVNR